MLNARKEKFVQGLLMGLTQRKAYQQAFPASKKYKPETIDNKACVLANSDEIKTRLRELTEKADMKAIMTRSKRMVTLSEIAGDVMEKTDSRIKAIDTLNKMDGQYTQKIEVSTPTDESAKAINEYFADKKSSS